MTVRDRILGVLRGDQPTRPGMHVSRGKYVKVSVADLRELAAQTPDHPTAKIYLRACADVEGVSNHVLVNAIDLQALAEGRNSTMVMSVDAGRIVEQKVLT